MRRALVWILALLAAGASHLLQRSADEIRLESNVDTELLFLPSGDALRVATMGHHETAANLLWVRAVLLFGKHHGREVDEGWDRWLVGMLKAIATLDPAWRTPYFYGGAMLRVGGATDASNELYLMAIEALPDDAAFPFALGMNYYLYNDDPVTAAEWITVAAQKPEAPQWYRVAAAGLMVRKDMRKVGIRYLEEQLITTTDPGILGMLNGRLVELYHDEAAVQLEELRQEYRSQRGQDIQIPQDLGKIGVRLPPDPLGGDWILAPDDEIRSSVREAEEAEKARKAERKLLLRK